MFVILTGESDDQHWLNMMKYFLNGSADKKDKDKDKALRLNHFSHLHTHMSEQHVYTTESFNWDIHAPNTDRQTFQFGSDTENKWEVLSLKEKWLVCSLLSATTAAHNYSDSLKGKRMNLINPFN